MKRVLIIYGGWEGHQPGVISAYLAKQLDEAGFIVTRVPSLDVLDDPDQLLSYDLIIMNWTRGELSSQRFENLSQVIDSGVGLAGIHGGLTSAFQGNKKWLWMTGGCFVAHPGGAATTYSVHITDQHHPITQGIKDFTVQTEQYFMLTDPANHVLATTAFAASDHPEAANQQPLDIPVAWTKLWGHGRIFFHSLGHDLAVCQQPEIASLTLQGFQWASR
ncbi:ThuA domain-containing protein [Lacticaseibacillus rhamnosus]|uniref:ThuA domain-containing protein n=1 Tax=Lacticaseibacillus rhamnosus TaxID=47715 RepID=UPI00065AE8AE|nr:ThuA domain-containing protein [Lacticaseibacillus rhamnosus]